MYSWVDASHAVHEDMKGHTGGTTSFGAGVINTKSTKQKLNTLSSTESELVGVSEYLPHCIWLMNFLEHQGYGLDKNIIFQDNISAIRLEQTGRNSCTGNSRHINIRFFFIKDRIDNKEVSVCYCPTELMLGDFYTKALQGSLFYKFRDVLMGYKKIETIMPSHITEFEERVGNTDGIPANFRNMRKQKNINKKVNFSDKVKSRTYENNMYNSNRDSEGKIQENNKDVSTYTAVRTDKVTGNDVAKKDNNCNNVSSSIGKLYMDVRSNSSSREEKGTDIHTDVRTSVSMNSVQ